MQYGNFAYVYDQLMQDIPYHQWVKYIKTILEKHQLKPNKVLDLGCGTGNVSLPLAKEGFAVTAVDMSTDMLNVAYDKALAQGVELQLVNQDIRELEVPGKYDLVLSMCDTLNYLSSLEDLGRVFHKVFEILEDGGLFIFDLNTFYKISEVFGDQEYCLNQEEISYIWENSYNPDEEVVTMDVTFFVKEEDGRFKRFVESHQEKGFHESDILDLLKQVGFTDIQHYQELTFESPQKDTERIYYIARKKE